MPVLRFFRKTAASGLGRLTADLNAKLTGVDAVTSVEFEFVYYVDVAKDSLTAEGK